MLNWLKDIKNAKEAQEDKLNRGQNAAGDIFANRKDGEENTDDSFANKVLNKEAMGSVSGAKSIQEILAEKAAQNAAPAPKECQTEISSKIDGITGGLKNKNLLTEVKGSGVNKNVSTSDAGKMVLAATQGVNASLFNQVKVTEAQRKANSSKNLSEKDAEKLTEGLASTFKNEVTYKETKVDAKKFEKQDDNDNMNAYELIGRMTSGLSRNDNKGEN